MLASLQECQEFAAQYQTRKVAMKMFMQLTNANK